MTQPEMMSPKEFSALLETRGVRRSPRWIRRQCRKGLIRTAPLGVAHVLIPATEADRLLTPSVSSS
jgi:hypothetical protein